MSRVTALFVGIAALIVISTVGSQWLHEIKPTASE
jgi:hypothetical protein